MWRGNQELRLLNSRIKSILATQWTCLLVSLDNKTLFLLKFISLLLHITLVLLIT